MAASAKPATGLDGLDNDLGWAIGVVSRRYRNLALGAVAELPGGPRGYHVLQAIAEGNPRSQLALAQRLGIDKTMMTYLIDDLEQAKLVTRRPDPQDRRARQIVITAAGSRALTRARKRVATAEAELLSAFTSKEAQTLRDLMGRLARPAPEAPTATTASASDCD